MSSTIAKFKCPEQAMYVYITKNNNNYLPFSMMMIMANLLRSGHTKGTKQLSETTANPKSYVIGVFINNRGSECSKGGPHTTAKLTRRANWEYTQDHTGFDLLNYTK